jgi:hypothetical protein
MDCPLVIPSDVISISLTILIAAKVLRVMRILLTGSRQMLRHNALKTAAYRGTTQTHAAESDASDLPVPQFEQQAL